MHVPFLSAGLTDLQQKILRPLVEFSSDESSVLLTSS